MHPAEADRVWGRVSRDPYTVLLGAAAVLQLALASAGSDVRHPAWALVAVGVFAVVCAAALVGRLRHGALVEGFPPFALLAVAGFWRAASDPDLPGFGALCVIAVIWLGFYGSRRQVWWAIAGSVASMVLPPLLVGEAIVVDDWRRAALTGAVCLLVGPTIRGLVERAVTSAQRVTALEPAGSRFDAVLRAASGNMIVVCDVDGTITDFNEGAERLLGYRADEVVGQCTPMRFHDPDDAGRDIYDRVAATGEVDIRECTYRTKDGRRVIVSLSLTPVFDADGNAEGFVGIGTDVTAARTTMQTLASQREIYRLLVENLPDTTVGLLDSDLRVITIGGHWLHRIGAEPSGFRGRPVESFFLEPDRDRMRALYERARSEPVSTQWDQDGRSYDLVAVPIAGADGENLVLTLIRDVTERREQERERQRMVAALAMSEASFREAFEGAPIGMALTTVQDGQDERFLQVNPAFAAILGRKPDDLVGTRVLDVTHPEDVALQPDLSEDAVGPRILRKRFMRPSGRAVWVEVSYAVVRDADGVPSHVIKQIQDIHTIKESERALLDALEQQRAATARLRELDRIRTDLVGTISHELRTPLTSIHGYLELLTDEPLSELQQGMLEVAIRNTERLAGLVDNLLVLVRLDSVDEGAPAGSENVDLSAAVSTAVDTVRPEIVERDQRLEVNLPIERPVVRGDFDQIDRVLVNLLSNASKYTPAGGDIDIDVAMTGSRVRITITDSGIGIPADEVPNLFTRFFRASSARANAISGNGLGLAIVKSIVERHGGEVSVSSTLGAGSCFTVELPVLARADATLDRAEAVG